MKVLHNLPIDLPEDVESAAQLPETISIFDVVLFQYDHVLLVIDIAAEPTFAIPPFEIKYQIV